MKKVPTGIEGLDEMLGGGFPSGRSILVCGAPGSGKTIFAMQFLCNGAVEHGERGVFVSLDESKPHLLQDVAGFGWNLLELEKKQLISIVDASPIRILARAPGKVKVGEAWVGRRDFSLLSLIGVIKRECEKLDAKRLVIDPISSLTVQFPDIAEARYAVLDLFEAIASLGTTTIATTELRVPSLNRIVKTEEFLSHGVLIFHVFHDRRELVRAVQIEKMRGTAHDQQIRPYRITEKGIQVYNSESPLTAATEIAETLI